MATVSEAFVVSTLRKAVLDCIARNTPVDSTSESPDALFTSPAAQAVKEEILSAGKKLWLPEYVDGNGGNISFRISENYVICTPTLCSKGDMLASDLSLVDLNNCRICGDRAQTSERQRGKSWQACLAGYSGPDSPNMSVTPWSRPAV